MLKRIARIGILTAVYAALLVCGAALLDFFRPVEKVEAQGYAPFKLTFTIPSSGYTQYIPACTTTSTNCIPDYKQIAHTVSYSYATHPGNNLLGNCGILLDGSNDNATWQTIAASGNVIGLQNSSFSANAYFPHLRLKIPPCASSAVSIIYIGFYTPVPVYPLSQPGASRYVVSALPYSTPAHADPLWATPAVLTGFQCSNPDPSNTAWLQLFVANTLPTLGNIPVFGMAIPAGQTVIYGGPPLSYYALSAGGTANTLFAAAATTAGLGQAVTFNATPTAVGSNYVQGDVGATLSVTACGATVGIAQVNGGSGTGGVTLIATTPTNSGFGCHIGTGQATTGGTGSGATVSITAAAGGTAVTTPIYCNFQTNGTGPYYPFNPPSL